MQKHVFHFQHGYDFVNLIQPMFFLSKVRRPSAGRSDQVNLFDPQIPNTLPPKHPYTRQPTNANPNHDPTPRSINQPLLTTIPAQQPINHQCQPRPRPKAKHLRPNAVTPTPIQQPLTPTLDPGQMQTSCCAVGFRSMALSLWATALSAFAIA